MLVALSPFAIDSYLAAMPIMAKFFKVGTGIIELTITLYFLAFAIGNFVGGPLSDSFGRKPVALTGMTIYAVSSIIISLSHTIEPVLFFRALQAFGAGFATVIANAYIHDLFDGKAVAQIVTKISMIMMLAPLIAPIIGAFFIHFKGWQGVFYFLFGLGGILFLIFLFLIPESLDKSSISKKISFSRFFEKYKIFFSDKQSVLLLFSISFSMAGMYVFLTDASFIYIEYFKINPDFFPILFGANVILNISLSYLNTYLLRFYKVSLLLRAGLLLQLLAGIMVLLSVYFHTPSFWGVFGGIVLFVGSLGLIFGNGTALILNKNPKISGSANATIGILRFLLSFVLGSLLALLHTKNIVPFATVIFTCTLLGNIFFALSGSPIAEKNG